MEFSSLKSLKKNPRIAARYTSAYDRLGGARPSTNWESYGGKNQMNSQIIPVLVSCKEQG